MTGSAALVTSLPSQAVTHSNRIVRSFGTCGSSPGRLSHLSLATGEIRWRSKACSPHLTYSGFEEACYSGSIWSSLQVRSTFGGSTTSQHHDPLQSNGWNTTDGDPNYTACSMQGRNCWCWNMHTRYEALEPPSSERGALDERGKRNCLTKPHEYSIVFIPLVPYEKRT